MSITINGDTGIAGVDGSASTPAVQGNDTNTGMFFPAADTIAFAEGGTEVMRLDSSGNLRVGSSSTSLNSINSANTFGFKNRIINGAMIIDQRNAGAAKTATSTVQYSVDRFAIFAGAASGAGVFTAQQVSDAPAGFIRSLRATVTTAQSGTSSDAQYFVAQYVEGLNCADLGFGSASASTITLSFWVKSSLTGTFAGAINNGGGSRSYVFTYAISSANTWEQKTITISGDTTGTWLTDNGMGLRVNFSLGTGTTFEGTAGVWSASYTYSTSAAVKVINTLNATWQITGVQLEKGSTATSFDYRPYGTELQLCQRYYWTGNIFGLAGYGDTTNLAVLGVNMPVTMRAQPSVTNASDSAGIVANGSLYNTTAATATILNSWFAGHNMAVAVTVNAQITRWTTCYGRIVSFQASAEL